MFFSFSLLVWDKIWTDENPHPLRFYPTPSIRMNWFFNVVAPLFPTEVFRKPLFPMGFFRIADFNPKSRADSPTAMNIKTAIFPLLRLPEGVNFRCLLLLFFTHHGAVLQKQQLRTIVLTLICDNTPDKVPLFSGR